MSSEASSAFPEEGETVGFVDSMEDAEGAVRMLTAMLNRFNRADVFIGVRRDGSILGIDVSENDIRTIHEVMRSKVNHLPDVSI